MKTIKDLKKWEFKNGEWYDENNIQVKVLWSKQEGYSVTEYSIHEDIEKVKIDEIEYTKLCYVYGQGLVITDETGRYTIKVSDLKNENKQDNKKEIQSIKQSSEDNEIKVNPTHTYIRGNNTIESIHKFKNNSIIVLDGTRYKVFFKNHENLTDEQIEARYGGYAVDDDVLKELYSVNYIYDFEKVD